MTDDQAIRELIARWHSATNAGDIETVLTLMADDVIFLAAGQPPMRGRAAFHKALRGLMKTHRIESSGNVLEVVVSGDLAYSWVSLSVAIAPHSGAATKTRTGQTMSILRKQDDGSWLMVRDANLLPPPQ
jgi:uncharacterized protein (TIGR02246 family)